MCHSFAETVSGNSGCRRRLLSPIRGFAILPSASGDASYRLSSAATIPGYPLFPAVAHGDDEFELDYAIFGSS